MSYIGTLKVKKHQSKVCGKWEETDVRGEDAISVRPWYTTLRLYWFEGLKGFPKQRNCVICNLKDNSSGNMEVCLCEERTGHRNIGYGTTIT